MGRKMRNVSGNSAVQAIELLIQKGVPESHIIFLNLISVSFFLYMTKFLSNSYLSQQSCILKPQKKKLMGRCRPLQGTFLLCLLVPAER